MMPVDPKPVVSLATEQVNLKHLYNKMIAARDAYSKAHLEWLRLGGHISDRLKLEREERRTNYDF